MRTGMRTGSVPVWAACLLARGQLPWHQQGLGLTSHEGGVGVGGIISTLWVGKTSHRDSLGTTAAAAEAVEHQQSAWHVTETVNTGQVQTPKSLQSKLPVPLQVLDLHRKSLDTCWPFPLNTKILVTVHKYVMTGDRWNEHIFLLPTSTGTLNHKPEAKAICFFME